MASVEGDYFTMFDKILTFVPTVNYVLVEALQTHHALSEGSLTVRVTSGQKLDLHIIAMEICHRVVALFMPKGGRRPLHGNTMYINTY